MKNTQKLLKCVSMYLFYFLYTYFASFLLDQFTEVNRTTMMLILDFFFLIVIAFVYAKNIKEDFQKMKKDYTFLKVLKVIITGIISIIVLNIVISLVMSLFFEETSIEGNTQAIYDLASLSAIYAIFKTMIFGTIAEELLFRESLSECITNDKLFILISAVIYVSMNFIFTNLSGPNLIAQIITYFGWSLIFSGIYVKNNRNIILVMITKFVYNLIPLMLMFLAR